MAMQIVGAEGSETIAQEILQQLRYSKEFLKPLHARMDYWMTMYLMLDAIQQSKPIGVRRFISNDPRTAVDAAVAIMTRNPIPWHIDQLGSEDENREEIRKAGRIERTLNGINFDLDEMMMMRLKPSWWVQVAQQVLLRGFCWGKVHITTEALKFRPTPLIGEVYDARTVYPHTDAFGLNYVIIEQLTNLGNMVAMYPSLFGDRAKEDQNTPVVTIEYWSNSRPNRPGIMGQLAVVGTKAQAGYELIVSPDTQQSAYWTVPPYYHGYMPEELPVFGIAANGLAVQSKPVMQGILESRLAERADLIAMRANQWHGPYTWIAETGRSILSAVEELVPQYNELIATIFQHFSIGTYGTWVFQNPTGEIPHWRPGIEAKIALKPDESVNRLDIGPITPDAYRLVQLLQQEREKGVLSSILQAATSAENFNSAVLFQQIANAALNALSPYVTGMKDFGMSMGRSVLAQLKVAAPILEPFELVSPTPKNTFFRIEFDPANDLDSNRKYRPVPVMKPALPDDLTIRMTAARMALDPRRPMLSLLTVLETILQVDDPMGELDRIWEDIALTDPVLVLEQVAMALERRGEVEMAARIRESEFRARLIEDLQFRQMTGNMPAPPGRGPAPSPETGMGVAQTAPAQVEAPPGAAEGAAVMGAAGETMMP